MTRKQGSQERRLRPRATEIIVSRHAGMDSGSKGKDVSLIALNSIDSSSGAVLMFREARNRGKKEAKAGSEAGTKRL